jgi:acetyl-CoA carboxylase biotin carboxyl carrier protein
MAKSDTKNDIDSELVRKLAKLLEETGLTEIEYGNDEFHLRVAKGAAGATALVAAPPVSASPPGAASEPEEDLAAHPGAITSPMVGIVYTAPEPGASPFVKVGDEVAADDSVLLIEAMKVFNQIKAGRAGKVVKILVKSGTPVEFGEPLMIIE